MRRDGAGLVLNVASTAAFSPGPLQALYYASKALLQFLLEREQFDPWLNANLGYWAHPLANYDASAVWTSDPKVTLFRDTMRSPFWIGYKGPISEASAAANAEYVMVQMCASVASGQATPEAAAREAERRARRYYRNT